MVLLALVSQVLSFYSLHISFYISQKGSLPTFQKISAPKKKKHFLKIGNTMEYYGVSSGDMLCHVFICSRKVTVCYSLFFNYVPEKFLEKSPVKFPEIFPGISKL